jgi:hypothetical protein
MNRIITMIMTKDKSHHTLLMQEGYELYNHRSYIGNNAVPLTGQKPQAICNSVCFFSTFTYVYYPKILPLSCCEDYEYISKFKG